MYYSLELHFTKNLYSFYSSGKLVKHILLIRKMHIDVVRKVTFIEFHIYKQNGHLFLYLREKFSKLTPLVTYSKV